MKYVDLSVPGYVQRKLTKWQHPKPKKPQHSPYQASPIVYGAKVQQPVQLDVTAPLTDSQIKRVQEIVGAFIWYGQAHDYQCHQLTVNKGPFEDTWVSDDASHKGPIHGDYGTRWHGSDALGGILVSFPEGAN